MFWFYFPFFSSFPSIHDTSNYWRNALYSQIFTDKYFTENITVHLRHPKEKKNLWLKYVDIQNNSNETKSSLITTQLVNTDSTILKLSVFPNLDFDSSIIFSYSYESWFFLFCCIIIQQILLYFTIKKLMCKMDGRNKPITYNSQLLKQKVKSTSSSELK